MPQARRRRRATGLVVVAVAAVVAAVAVAVVVLRSDDEPTLEALRPGSVIERGAVVAVVRTPETYRVEYVFEGRAGERPVRSTDVISAQRPFERRLDTYAGPAAGGAPVSTEILTFGLLSTRTSGNPAVLVRAPGPVPGDIRPRAVLDDAMRGGLLERRERRRVAGRPCQVYRSGALLTADRLVKPTAREYADTCIDEAGLMLEEVLVVDGALLLRRAAVRVEEDITADPASFAIDKPPVAPELGGGSIVAVTVDSRPPGQQFWELPADPAGFVRRGRYAVAEAAAAGDGARPGPARRLTYVADVYQRGADVVVIDQGGTTDGTPPFPARDPTTGEIDGGAVGTATVVLTASEVSLRVEKPGGKFVRVRGTLPPAELAAVARSLVAMPGGQITPLQPGS